MLALKNGIVTTWHQYTDPLPPSHGRQSLQIAPSSQHGNAPRSEVHPTVRKATWIVSRLESQNMIRHTKPVAPGVRVVEVVE